MEEDFLKTLQQNRAQRVNHESLEVIDRFCQSILDFTYQKVECWRESGFVTNFGQEWRVMVKSTTRSHEQILFRAYVPLSGYPVQIDLYAGEMTTCVNEIALRRVLNRFLQQPAVQETIEYLSNGTSTKQKG